MRTFYHKHFYSTTIIPPSFAYIVLIPPVSTIKLSFTFYLIENHTLYLSCSFRAVAVSDRQHFILCIFAICHNMLCHLRNRFLNSSRLTKLTNRSSGVDLITGLILRALAINDLIPVSLPFFRKCIQIFKNKICVLFFDICFHMLYHFFKEYPFSSHSCIFNAIKLSPTDAERELNT